MALGINWDEALNEILSEENERIKVREFVKNVRVRSNISLLELSEITGVPENDLEVFESGQRIDIENELRVFVWFFEIEQDSVQGEELKEKFRLCYLLCKAALCGPDKLLEILPFKKE